MSCTNTCVYEQVNGAKINIIQLVVDIRQILQMPRNFFTAKRRSPTGGCAYGTPRNA